MRLKLKKYDQDIAILEIHNGRIQEVQILEDGVLPESISNFIEERRYPVSRPESRYLRDSGFLEELRRTRLSDSEDGI